MPDTGWTLAGAGVNNSGAGDVAWSNPGNITDTNDSNYAQSAVGKSQTSQYLHATNFSLSVPSGATINGIEARLRRYGQAGIQEYSIELIVGGSRAGDNKSALDAWTASATNVDFGGASDLWGLTLSQIQVTASNFGLAVRVSNTAGASRSARVMSVWIRAHYTPPSNNTGAFFALFNVKDRLREILKPKKKFWLPEPAFARAA